MNDQLQPAVVNVKIFPDGRMTAADAACYAGVSEKTLAVQRCEGNGPPYIKLGKRVFYLKADLDHWIVGNRTASTAEHKARARRAALGGER